MTSDIEKLRTAASERWDDEWTIREQHYADGTSRAHAFRNSGKNADGLVRKERLMFGADGEIYYQRVLVDQERTVEILEQDDVPPEIRGEIIYDDSG